MKVGIVGLPNVGKSALFNAISGRSIPSSNFPFCTVEPNFSVVPVPDDRVTSLSEMYDTDKTTFAEIEFVDIAGLVKGASKGEGLGNKFLSSIREVDAIVHVVRCFDNDDIIHVSGSVDPLRDIEIINLELILSDLEIVSKKIDKVKKLLKADKKYEDELQFWNKIQDLLEKESKIRNIQFSQDDMKFLSSVPLLCTKPVIYLCNISEDDINKECDYYKLVKKLADDENSPCLCICAELESQLSQLSFDVKQSFVEELGIKDCALDILIKTCYEHLNLISFLTAGKQEVRAWTITRGTKAPQAAGKIHSDMEKGFIRAEVVKYDSLIKCGSISRAKELGLISSEGKNYEMQDGDVVLFRFNV